ncbi:MAG: EamA family transporter [Rhizobiales bacterium]|nr:EamA family transporter [Hyphomicrobiales bacterium]
MIFCRDPSLVTVVQRPAGPLASLFSDIPVMDAIHADIPVKPGMPARHEQPPAGTRHLPETSDRSRAEGFRAKLLLVALALAWGVNWPANKVALAEVGPWTFRVVGLAVGAVLMLALATWRSGRLVFPSGWAWLHLAVAGTLNIGAFAILSVLALEGTNTSRVVILVYTMPIWAVVMARLLLGERLTVRRLTALLLCVAGLTVLLAPHLPLPAGLWWALATAWCWAGGTVYMKWAKVDLDPMTTAAWQILVGWIGVAIGTVILGEPWYVWPVQPVTLVAWAWSAAVGVGFAYFMWFIVVERLPASNAALAALLIPVVGVSSSALLLGEAPTLNDTIGFALVFAAAASVLLQPSRTLVAARAE